MCGDMLPPVGVTRVLDTQRIMSEQGETMKGANIHNGRALGEIAKLVASVLGE